MGKEEESESGCVSCIGAGCGTCGPLRRADVGVPACLLRRVFLSSIRVSPLSWVHRTCCERRKVVYPGTGKARHLYCVGCM